MPAFVDLTGKRFNRRVVIRLVSREKKKGPIWEVKCDCGKVQFLQSGNVTRNHSCGCYCKEQTHLHLSKSPGEAAKNNLYVRTRANAKQRGLEFFLSIQECEKLWEGLCHYCGAPPSQISRNGSRRFNGDYIFNGIDRVDNNIGYAPRNCVSCCKICNYMKKAHPYDVFVGHILRMAETLKKERNFASAS